MDTVAQIQAKRDELADRLAICASLLRTGQITPNWEEMFDIGTELDIIGQILAKHTK